nr:unnamed protein product [Callosobruchus chinensis]
MQSREGQSDSSLTRP